MRAFLNPSSSKSSWLIHSTPPQKRPLCCTPEIPQKFPFSDSQDVFPSKNATESNIKTTCADNLDENLKKPVMENEEVSQTHVVESLLRHRNDPGRAFNYFKRAEIKRGFLRGFSDPHCVLLHILVSSPDHCTMARKFLNSYVSSDSSPSGILLFYHLVNCAERFDFAMSNEAVVFNYLLNSYVRAGRLRDAIDCFNAMILRNLMPEVRVVNLTLNALVRRNMISEARIMYDGIVSRKVGGHDCFTVQMIMRACLKEGKVKDAENYFYQAKASGLALDAAVYSTSVHVCSKLNVENTCELLYEMKRMGWVPSECTFTNVISACVKSGNMVLALKMKDEMIECGHAMNLIVATNLMKGYYKLQENLNAALDLFDKIVEDGLNPNKVTYAVLIEGCSRHGNMEKACELYTKMKLAGIQPTEWVVNSLIRGFLKAGLLDKAIKYFDEAVEANIANAFTYSIFVCWYARRGKVGEARVILDKMVANGFEPSVILYNDMILGNCRAGNMDAALSLFSEMLERNLGANVVTYSNLIDGYFKKGEQDLAIEMFDRMVSCGVAPNDFIYNTIINGLCKVGRTTEAKSCLYKFSEMGLTPLDRAYNSIIDGFVKEGSITSAMAVYEEMGQRKISPNVVTYTSLISGFCKSKNIDLALKLASKMKTEGIEWDLTVYCVLIDGFCKKGDMESACKLFNKLFEVGLSANSFVYNSMISGYRGIKNMEEAIALHKRMITEGIPCDLETYTTLIDGLLKDGKLLLASDLFMEMLAKDIRPDEITHSVLVQGLCNKRQLENARKILDDMYKKNLTPNVLIYNTLIAGYFKEGNLLEAFRLHDEMLDRGLTPDDTTYDVLVAGKFKVNSSPRSGSSI